jgi:hypothetical protein
MRVSRRSRLGLVRVLFARDLTDKLNEQLEKLDAEDRAWALHLMSEVCAKLAKPRASRNY